MVKSKKDDGRIGCIPVLSFFLTCIFVVYHVVIPGDGISSFDTDLNNWMKTLNEQLATVALSYFFGVTGFLLFKNMTKKSMLRKIKTRFMTLFVPYIFWQFLFLGIFYLTGRFRTWEVFVYYIKRMFLFAGYPPDIPLWYVYTVFVWALLSPLILLLLKNKNVGFVVLMASFIAIHLVMTNEAFRAFSGYGIVSLTLKYAFAYLMGAYYGLHFPDNRDLDSVKYIAFTLQFGFAISSASLNDLRTSFIIASILSYVNSSPQSFISPIIKPLQRSSTPFNCRILNCRSILCIDSSTSSMKMIRLFAKVASA